MHHILQKYGFSLAAIFLVACVPSVSYAAQFRHDEERLHIRDGVSDDLFGAGGQVVVEAPITGDAYFAGGTVEIRDTVEDDLFVAGGNIRVEGAVHGDLRVAGGQVVIAGPVEGDVIAMGGQIEITSQASVGGELITTGGQVTVAGTTHAITAAVGKLVIDQSATVEGDITYWSDETATIEEGSAVSGSVVQHRPVVHEKASSKRSGGLIWVLASVVMALLLGYALPSKSEKLVLDWRQRFGINFLWGLLFLIVTPFVGILLFATILGIPLGMIMFVLYGILLYIGKLVSSLAVGAWIQSLWTEGNGFKPIWASAVIGVIVMSLLMFVPILGWLVVFVAFLGGVGALVRYDWGLVKDLRKRSDL